MNNHASVPVGVLGASGYVGRELLRLLAGHPATTVVFATAESAAGEWQDGQPLIRVDDAPLHDAAVVLSALPHGVSARYVQAARAGGARAIDLSADFRLSADAVYGLTEFTRPRVADAELVANPGCYPTAALLALIPLAQLGLIDASREIIIDAASGVTGAGRNPRRELLFGEVAEDFRAYAIGNSHRHLTELKRALAREGGFLGDLVFTPHLLPVKRGILETIHVPLTRVLDQATAEGLYASTYHGEPCVQVMHGTLPSLKDVVYRNRVALGVAAVADVRRPRLTVIAAIDNLVKGAAGQAIQNMNVMLGLPETAGLAC
ncbi:MAG: N-acetyl-gamma-glutamyl-phosphate reductase [Gemmatimonadales bacterium]